MSYFGLETFNENQSEENLDEESVILTLVPFKEEEEEEPITDYPTQSNVSSSTLDHTPPARSLVRHAGIKHPTRTIPSTCPPPSLPPIRDVSRNTLREWCRYHNLSTDGKVSTSHLDLLLHRLSMDTLVMSFNITFFLISLES